MALMRSTATVGVLAVAWRCGRGVHAVEEATETEEGHFGFARDTTSRESVPVCRSAGRVWEKAASGAAYQKDSCWIADALLDAKIPSDGDGESLSRDLASKHHALLGVPEQ
jgi:hypothetical protein